MTLTIAGRASRAHTFALAIYLYVLAVLVAGAGLPTLALLANRGYIELDTIHHSMYELHEKHLYFQLASLVVFLVLVRPVFRLTERVCRWISDHPDQAYGACAAVFVTLLLVTTYGLRGHIIMSSKGVPGWHYNGSPSLVDTGPPADPVIPEGLELRPFEASLRLEPLSFLSGEGYISGNIFLMHYRDGSAFPGNFGLTVNTWPLTIFAIENGKFRYEDALLEVVRHTLEKRRLGRKSSLPEIVSYPNHVNFQHIDYTGYPPATELVGISYWDATVHVRPAARSAEIVGLSLLAEIAGE